MIAEIAAMSALIGSQVSQEQIETRTPPFLLLQNARPRTAAELRVVAAVWADGRVIRATDPGKPGTRYRAGVLNAASLQSLICEIEAVGIWDYEVADESGFPVEELWMRKGTSIKHWSCDLELVFSECRFGEFLYVKKALLVANPVKSVSVTWDGETPRAWETASSIPVTAPRCKTLANPAQILSELRPGTESKVLDSLFEKQGRWAAVLDGIGSGHRDWLEIAEWLGHASDGAAAEDLGGALGNAFIREPVTFLRRFGGEQCGSLGFSGIYLDEKQYLALLKRARARAEGITEPDLAGKKEKCLLEIGELENGAKTADP